MSHAELQAKLSSHGVDFKTETLETIVRGDLLPFLIKGSYMTTDPEAIDQATSASMEACRQCFGVTATEVEHDTGLVARLRETLTLLLHPQNARRDTRDILAVVQACFQKLDGTTSEYNEPYGLGIDFEELRDGADQFLDTEDVDYASQLPDVIKNDYWRSLPPEFRQSLNHMERYSEPALSDEIMIEQLLCPVKDPVYIMLSVEPEKIWQSGFGLLHWDYSKICPACEGRGATNRDAFTRCTCDDGLVRTRTDEQIGPNEWVTLPRLCEVCVRKRGYVLNLQSGLLCSQCHGEGVVDAEGKHVLNLLPGMENGHGWILVKKGHQSVTPKYRHGDVHVTLHIKGQPEPTVRPNIHTLSEAGCARWLQEKQATRHLAAGAAGRIEGSE